jgi:hypothetical protein
MSALGQKQPFTEVQILASERLVSEQSSRSRKEGWPPCGRRVVASLLGSNQKFSSGVRDSSKQEWGPDWVPILV